MVRALIYRFTVSSQSLEAWRLSAVLDFPARPRWLS